MGGSGGMGGGGSMSSMSGSRMEGGGGRSSPPPPSGHDSYSSRDPYHQPKTDMRHDYGDPRDEGTNMWL